MASYDELLSTANNYVAGYNPNEQVNLNDSRLTTIENQRNNAIAQSNATYNNMASQSDQFYNNQTQVAQDYANKQQQLQNDLTNQAIAEINQEKAKTERDYQKEQRGAYADYARNVNNYGINAEINAARGLSNTGYAESSRVSMYNAYQNRVATARQSLQDSLQGFNNAIAQARLNNSTKQAEIAYNLAKTQAENALANFQYKNTLVEAGINQANVINNRYDSRYNNMLGQLNQELANRQNAYKTYAGIITNEQERQDKLAAAEQERQLQQQKLTIQQQQFDREMALKQQQYDREQQRWQQQYDASQAAKASSGSRSSGGSSKGSSEIRQLQQMLKEAGYDPGPIDGIDGPKTQAALAKYRAAQGQQSEQNAENVIANLVPIQGALRDGDQQIWQDRTTGNQYVWVNGNLVQI